MTPKSCPRCDGPMRIYTMSRFNTEEICTQCEAIERLHPLYPAAAAAELAAVRAGDYNFPGVGAPIDLLEFTRLRRRISE